MLTHEQLVEAGRKGGRGNRHHWTDANDDMIRLYYKQTKQSKYDLAASLGVSFAAVSQRVQKLGLAKRTARKNWDARQDDRLRELYTQYSPNGVAKRMHRSINSVIMRAKRLGLSRRARDDWYTKSDVAEILGVDHKRIQSYIDSGQLIASRHIDPESQCKNTIWHIGRDDLVKFIRLYCHEFNGRNVDLIQIVDLLVGLDYRNTWR